MSEVDFNENEFNTTKVEYVKCPNCGNNLKFNPEKQNLYCEYCDSVIEFEKNSNYQELNLNSAIGDHQTWDTTAKMYYCENCNAKVVLAKSETAGLCPFCGTAHVVSLDELPGVKPNVVVPFSVSLDGATDSLKKWAKKKPFAPTKFKKKFSPTEIKGVYMPCYTFDSNTYSTYDGRIGYRRTRTVGSGKNRRTETYIEWRHISGVFEHFFDDITISASQGFTQKDLKSTGGYSADKNMVYDDEYLLGYVAYAGDKPLEPCWDEAKGVIDSQLRGLILSQYNHDVVSYLNVSTTHQNVTYKYVMVPIYVGNYKYRKKVYRFMINGTTAKTTGKAPVSPLRVIGTVLFCIAVAIGLYFVIKYSDDSSSASAFIQNATNLLVDTIRV
jgi:DNA-directed RNA polymerase subunit RPC12/RpoP